MRDVRVRDQLSPGLRVKIVQPKDEKTGLTTEGLVAEVLSKEAYDPAGIEVRLASGETGRVLRVWAPPLEKRAEEKLPTFEPPVVSRGFRQFLPQDREVEERAAEVLGEADLDFMIEQRAQGFSGDALRKFGIRSEELADKTRDLLEGVDDEELERRMKDEPPP